MQGRSWSMQTKNPKDRVEEDVTMMGDNELPAEDQHVNDIDYNMVTLNKEYVGNSFFDNLSKMDSMGNNQIVAEDGEMEVTSEQPEKQRKMIDFNGVHEADPLIRSQDISSNDMQTEKKDKREKINMHGVNIQWQNLWSQSAAQENNKDTWSELLQHIKERGEDQEIEELPEGYTYIIQQLKQQVCIPSCCFFDKFHPLVECLAKWLGSYKLIDHEAWRKIVYASGHKARWLDVERENCHPEEATHRKKKKKQKWTGKNPFNNVYDKETDISSRQEGARIGAETRKKHKIWFFRNRRSIKNISLQKVTFSQEPIPMNASLNLMGVGEFKTGHAKAKDSLPSEGIKKSHMSRMDNLFEELMTRKARLKEIATNINTTDENKMLVTSILAIKSYKVLKFSAKMNEQGQVTIDENMVELDKGLEINDTTHTEISQSTYANMLSGQNEEKVTENKQMETTHNIQNAKLDQLKPPDNDGFTLVTRRKGLGGAGNKPRESQNQNKHKPAHEGSSGHKWYNAVSGDFTYERNIVNWPVRNEMPNSSSNHTPTSKPSSTNHPSHAKPSGNTNQSNGSKPNKPSVQTSRDKEPTIELIETSNRFVLLDNEGNEMPNMKKDTDIHNEENTNAYTKGTVAASHERMRVLAQGSNINENEDTHIEEVDSETDGAAEMMKSDSPPDPISSENQDEGMIVCDMPNLTADMLLDANSAGVI
ncbi:hypothetical protein L1987_39806 [Smallanthus sonchifolius]|uniref:Uncharacterized protein n=1 Tax=Smallanthus sonchifolius TaxID=185202 RepID=A0ACB9HMT8_9ASTR|nr:hypothetical protein L1987_39806 [Smallanthus sonchifolius]